MQAVSVRVTEKKIPTYTWAEPEELPMFAKSRVHQRLSGNPYPNRIVNQVRRDELTDRPYSVIELENAFLKLEIIPELGGRIFSALDKKTGYDFFYRQHVIKPALIGMLGLWVSGGMEFNWPVHHNPATFAPVEYRVEHGDDGVVTVWLGSRDPIDRIAGEIGIRVTPDTAFFETTIRITNTHAIPKSFMWWENAAVPVNEEYEIFFPHDVTYVDFHYKKTRGAFPVMDSWFNTMDNRGGNDIRKHRNTTSATSYFCGKTKGDFFGGYDHRKQAGVIHYAPHHTSTGAKMFTWGYGQIGRSWERALTDTDGPYAELMASSYSDNQPDLTWLEPYETKQFSQYWYSYQGIGPVDCANLSLAVRVEKGRLLVYPTRAIPQVVFSAAGEMVTADLTAAESREFRIPGLTEDSRVTVTDRSGRVLLDYRKPEAGYDVPEPKRDYPYPDELHDSQGCYLTGLHIAQYRDPVMACEPYYLRGLQIQKDHYPCMVGLARFYIGRLQYAEAEQYARQAVGVLTRYNENPKDTEAFTLLAISLMEQGQYDEAYEALEKAVWSRTQVSTAGLLAARIDCIRGDYGTAEETLVWVLDYGGRNVQAENLLAMVYKVLGREGPFRAQLKRCLSLDRFNLLALHESGSLDLHSWKNDKVQAALDLVEEYAAAGFTDEASEVLGELADASPMIPVLSAYLNDKPLDIEHIPSGPCFPSRGLELKALRSALKQHPDDPTLNLLLGDLLYGKCDDAEAALGCFRKAGEFLEARRNLAVVLHRLDREDPEPLRIMGELAEEYPEDLQVLYEFQHLCFLKREDPLKMLSYWEARRSVMALRDDTYLQGVQAANRAGRFAYALELLEAHEFIPCEGGEHAVADEYLLAKLEIGKQLLREKEYNKAETVFSSALQIPENLGGGVWHQVKLIAFLYYLGVCCREAGREEEAVAYFEQVLDFPTEYFTDMYNLEHRYYKGLALTALGREEEGRQVSKAYEQLRAKQERRNAEGYLRPTPFFNSFL